MALAPCLQIHAVVGTRVSVSTESVATTETSWLGSDDTALVLVAVDVLFAATQGLSRATAVRRQILVRREGRTCSRQGTGAIGSEAISDVDNGSSNGAAQIVN